MLEERELLERGLKEIGLAPGEKQIEQFMRYMDLLLAYNEKVNLTAITEPREIITKHFLDCAALAADVSGELIDVGTGGGFPGIPLKIMLPEIKLTLLDSLNKRVVFLNETVKALGLEHVTCVHGRAEDFGAARAVNREIYDTVVSRAVANLSSLVEYCLPFAKIGGKFISMKGSDVKEEISVAKNAIFTLGGEISQVKAVKIPFTDIEHSLIIISKIKHTPVKYPRKSVKITKSPII